MADSVLSVSWHGLGELHHELDSMSKDADRATRAAVVRASARLRALVRGNISGPPRWVKGRHQPRGGGPGNRTGATRKGIHTLAPRRTAGGWEGKVSAMGGARNQYAARLEAAYPFMRPAYEAWAEEAGQVFEAEWEKAFARYRK